MTETLSYIPELRFPQFKKKWEEQNLSQLVSKVSKPVNVELNKLYTQLGLRSHGKGVFHKEQVFGKTLGNKRVFWVKENCLILNIVFAWEQAIGITKSNDIGTIASHRFPMYAPINGRTNLEYLLHFFLTPKGKRLLEIASPGGAGRNKTLGQKEFESLKFLVPEVAEQEKIGSLLSAFDKKISNLIVKKDLLEQYKYNVLKQILAQTLRFKKSHGKYEKWGMRSLESLLDYQQPTPYIVNSTDYGDEHKTPVLTAGKSFILGYTDEVIGIFNQNLPVIIFDDFTTSIQFVDFPFKVKSSAIKILLPKSGVNIRFVYEVMRTINYNVIGHERHWISKYSKMQIPYPGKDEQDTITEFLELLNNKIRHCEIQIQAHKKFKQGLIQKMFC